MKLVADLHIHSISSGHAYSTLEEYLAQAKKIKLKAIGLTDHGPAMPGGPHYYHFANMRMIPRQVNGIRIYRGIEANIINEQGEIDLAEQDIKWGELDIVMAALHPRVGYEDQGETKNTEVVLKAFQNPYINVLAHPGNPKYPLNVSAVVAAAKEHRVLIEINNSSEFSRPGSEGRCLEFAREIKRVGWQIIIGTDSHLSGMLGDFRAALKLIKAAGLTVDDIVNTSLAKIDRFLANRK